MSQASRYPILIERAADGGYGAWAPDLPGCVALGDTIEETQQEMMEAIDLHLEGLAQEGADVPTPSSPDGGAFVRLGSETG